jgi:hypothetical protein
VFFGTPPTVLRREDSVRVLFHFCGCEPLHRDNIHREVGGHIHDSVAGIDPGGLSWASFTLETLSYDGLSGAMRVTIPDREERVPDRDSYVITYEFEIPADFSFSGRPVHYFQIGVESPEAGFGISEMFRIEPP